MPEITRGIVSRRPILSSLYHESEAVTLSISHSANQYRNLYDASYMYGARAEVLESVKVKKYNMNKIDMAYKTGILKL